MVKAIAIRIAGIVQGIGFRPFIYVAATKHKLYGFVKNKGGEVSIHIEGIETDINTFLDYITKNYPQGTYIYSKQIIEEQVKGFNSFKICESQENEGTECGFPADIGICDECRADILNQDSRYYGYPFTSCTKCGPRLTIINSFPYDRCNTTMETFKMCKKCEEEYTNPFDRRYHAQTICCINCGPRVRLIDNNAKELKGDPFKNAQRIIKEGKILAVKGIGGYHLVCNARHEDPILKLREKKNRISKPFALMFKELESIEAHCYVSREEKNLLVSPQKPIVLLNQKFESNLPSIINPELNVLGAMLPYSGIHFMLFENDIDAIIVTSGNISGMPLIIKDDDALKNLSEIAEAFLVHNREILCSCDDSVSKVVQGVSQNIRRSRGYTSIPVNINYNKHSILACGADLKNTFCILKGETAIVSQHMGDINKLETLQVYEENIKRYMEVLNFKPKIIACDIHPDYMTTRYAKRLEIPIVKIQHHHAHIAGVLAEHNCSEKVIGVAFDGTGYGPDGTIWGGEFLIASLNDYKRVGFFKQMLMPGGEMAASQPWRMAGAYLQDAFGEELFKLDIECIKELIKNNWVTLWKSTQLGINSILTSSAGRLFDAVSAILGICYYNYYEGKASIELESMADYDCLDAYKYEICEKNNITVDFRKTIRGLVDDIISKINRREIVGKFHNTIVLVVVDICERVRNIEGINTVALSGGVFQNGLLLEKTICNLTKSSFNVLRNSIIPCNDGGICMGQAAIASKRINNILK